jgi:hypothetical protein
MAQLALDQTFPVDQEALWTALSDSLGQSKQVRLVRSNDWIKRHEVEISINGTSIAAVLQLLSMGPIGSLLRLMAFLPLSKSGQELDVLIGSFFSQLVHAISSELRGRP